MDPVFHNVLAYSLALLFGSAVLHKLRDIGAFRGVIGAYELLPGGLLTAAAALVIAVEIAITALLLIPAYQGLGAIAAGALLGGYALVITLNLARGRRDVDCGCNGFGAKQTLSPWLVVRNLVLIAACVASAMPVAARALHWLDGALIVLGILTLALLYTAMQQLIANHPRLAALRAHGA